MDILRSMRINGIFFSFLFRGGGYVREEFVFLGKKRELNESVWLVFKEGVRKVDWK